MGKWLGGAPRKNPGAMRYAEIWFDKGSGFSHGSWRLKIRAVTLREQLTPTVDGNQKSGEKTRWLRKVVELPLFTRFLGGDRQISEPSFQLSLEMIQLFEEHLFARVETSI